MSEQHSKPILVAIGHDPVDAALQYAARDATRQGCGLHLLHVAHDLVQGPNAVLLEHVDLEQAGRLALGTAVEKARDLLDDHAKVTSELAWGVGVVSSIVKAAESARSVVLQRRSVSRLERIVTRSVSAGVAAHAHVPVVSVPTAWSPTRSTGPEATVTVGIDVPERSEQLLRLALAEAQNRNARLRIVHTWSFPGAYEDLLMPPEEQARWATRATAEIRQVLDLIGADALGVEVTIEARHAYPSDALIEFSRDSDLLIVGRHDPLVPFGSHLGPVARSVLREAGCPVLLADPSVPRRKAGRPRRIQVG